MLSLVLSSHISHMVIWALKVLPKLHFLKFSAVYCQERLEKKKILLTKDLIVASHYETCSGSNTDLVAVFKNRAQMCFSSLIFCTASLNKLKLLYRKKWFQFSLIKTQKQLRLFETIWKYRDLSFHLKCDVPSPAWLNIDFYC